MKISLVSQIVVGASLLFGGIATPMIQNLQSQEAAAQVSDNWLRLTLTQLSQFDGQNGALAYLAYQGDIYDVTNASGFNQGVHQGMHLAGKDVTDILPTAPHGISILNQLTIIGELISEPTPSSSLTSSSETSPLPPSTSTPDSEVCIWIETDDAFHVNADRDDDDDDDDWDDHDDDDDDDWEDEDDDDHDDWDDEDEDDDDGFWSCTGGTNSGTTGSSTVNPNPSTSLPNSPSADGKYYLTLQELSYYTGANGRPAWIAVYGKIYDVTNESAWKNGVHRGMQLGGKDASSVFDSSPHSQSLLNSMKHIGFLVSNPV